MTAASRDRWARPGRILISIGDDVFDVVDEVRDDVLALHVGAVRRGEPLRHRDVAGLGASLRRRLGAQGDVITGVGVVLAPGVLADRHLCLEWWRAGPVALTVDLNPASTGFYDYATAEWFDAPRHSGRRHVVGPYVDVHGTGEYVLTFTVPVAAGGRFLGVAGADVPASRLEDRLLDVLPSDMDVVVLDAAGRVVLSSSTRWLVGELVPAGERLPVALSADLPDLPWRALLLEREQEAPSA